MESIWQNSTKAPSFPKLQGNGEYKDYSFNISRCTETYTSSYLILNENGELLNEDAQTAADLAIYREALPELMEFIEVTNTVTGVQ